MPFKTTWIKPEIFIHNFMGVWIYRVYRNDDIDAGIRENWFTLDPKCGEGVCECKEDECQKVFDIRTLPTYREEVDDMKKFGVPSTEYDCIPAALFAAIKRGIITPCESDREQGGRIDFSKLVKVSD